MSDFFSSGEAPDWIETLPSQFHRTFLGVHLWQWIGLVILIAVALAAMVVGRYVAIRVMRTRDRYLPGEISPETQRAMRRAAGLLAGVLVCYPLTGPLALPPKMDRGVMLVLQAMTILAFGMLAYSLWDSICDSMASRAAGVSAKAERLLVPLTRKFVRAIIVLVIVIVALSTMFNVNVAALITSLGIGGIVIALAAKDSVENIFGSVTILFDMPFAIGDRVQIDGIEGIVEEINLRSTRIRTFEDTVVNLPNANLIRTKVENWSARRFRRQKLNLRVTPTTPQANVELLCADLRTFIAAQERVDSERVLVNLHDVDDLGFVVGLQFFIEADTQGEEWDTRHKVLAEMSRLRTKYVRGA